MGARKKIRISDLFVTFCFLAFLFVAMIVTVTREKEVSSFYENRMLAEMPVYTAEGDGDGSYMGQWEKYVSDHAAMRNTLLKIKTWMDLAIHRPVVNEVAIGDGILLPYHTVLHVSEEGIASDADFMADNLKGIHDVVASYGGYYCYVSVPSQSDYYPDRFPSFLDNREELIRMRAEQLTRAMEERGVDFLNISDVFREMGHPDGYSSKVDNHYSMRGAFLSYQRILEHVTERTGLDIPILRDEDVIIEELPNKYLGSRERKLLSLIDLEEKLSVLYPKEEVPFTRTDMGRTMDPTVYALPGSEEEILTYNLYMGGDKPETVIDTHREELPSVLIYGDSMTNAMECVMYLSFDKMWSVDLRHYTDRKITEYIEMVKPDVVLCIRDPEDLLSYWGNGGMELVS